jgi:hypothetical protein
MPRQNQQGLLPQSVKSRHIEDGVALNTPVLTSPTITDYTSAQHTHQDAQTGGTLDTLALLANAITNPTMPISTLGPAVAQSIGTTYTDFTNATGTFISQDGGTLLVIATFGSFKSTATGLSNFRVKIGTTNVPDATGWTFFWNTLLEHQSHTWMSVVGGIAAGTYTVSMQGVAAAASLSCDNSDQFILTILELKR